MYLIVQQVHCSLGLINWKKITRDISPFHLIQEKPFLWVMEIFHTESTRYQEAGMVEAEISICNGGG